MGLTPMMRQYMEIKNKYQDCILFYRLGDFYEMFFEDAKIASKELELVLTGRECGLEERAPMCGIPFHAASNYISRLIAKGYKVGICEQVEDPAQAKGIVKRDVIKVITPGTFSEANGEEEYKNTYIMAIYNQDGYYGVASSDISTGEFKTTFFKELKTTLLDEVSKISPKEVIVDINFDEDLINEIHNISNALITKKDILHFNCTDDELINQFSEVEIAGLDLRSKIASSILLKYILDTQKMSLSNINILETYSIVNYMTIDSSSRRNLELTENLKEKSKKGSLIWVLDKTSTTMGGRALRKWIEEPLINIDEINNRLNSVDELFNNIYFTEELREALRDIYDIERIVGKISNKNVNAKDLISLNISLKKLPEIKERLSVCKADLLNKWYKNLDVLEDISTLLSKALLEDPATSIKEGNIIRAGYSEKVDELREAKLNGKQWIASLESKEREFTGIKSLKIGYNKVFGYYIEISKANYNLIPEGRYIRKQTLANAERYITEELKVVEEKILGADEHLMALEYELFVELRDKVEAQIPRLKNSANIISSLDALTTLAKVAVDNDYIRPNINNEGIIEIEDGRHPVVEKVSKKEYVSNDCMMSEDVNTLLITGPNMSGKSTYMRQLAIIIIMAQIGSFVPAKSAKLPIFDKIFTRIGASDDLVSGESTFMVEMMEARNALVNATSDSLILFDELGRGTATYDGMSLAQAILEYVNRDIKCKTLFSTHYHELTALESLSGIKNVHVEAYEKDGNVTFLHKVKDGAVDKSYGIHVAKLAGMPKDILNRSSEILKYYESNGKESLVQTNEQLGFNFDAVVEDSPVLDRLEEIDPLKTTPMEAINLLYELKELSKK